MLVLSLALKYTQLPSLANQPASDPSVPGLMSLIIVVLDVVPSLVQASGPCMLSLAWKYKTLPAEYRPLGVEPVSPARISFSIIVPLVVPSDVQSSRPWMLSVAVKNSLPFA